ncbi:MAG: hypothetical protein U1F50_07490 [Rubrivivax sp.]
MAGEDADVDPVGVVAGLHVEEAAFQRGRVSIAVRTCARSVHGAVLLVGLLQRFGRGAQRLQVQRHADRETLVEVGDDGRTPAGW